WRDVLHAAAATACHRRSARCRCWGRVIATPNGISIVEPGRLRSPGIGTLLIASSGCVFPLGFARKEPAIPDAKCVSLIEVDARDRKVFVGIRGRRPRGIGRA